MKLRKFMCMAVTASIIMSSAAALSMPTVSAETVNTTTEFSEDFESYGVLNQQNTLLTLKDSGWYACDHTKLYTNVSTVAPYSTMNYKLANTETVDGSTVLKIITAGGTEGETQAKYGYGVALPGASNGKASGVYEVQFDYKPILGSKGNGLNKTQFYFGLNTADGSASNETNAQHNIMSGYNANFYIGNRNYQTLYNAGKSIPQGTLPALDIGGVKWYTVKAVVNCDARYYSVELYDRATEKLIARRSPISFAENENVGFLKFSALGLAGTYSAAVYIDNVSIKKTTIEKTIYEDSFDSYTTGRLATSGVTIGGSTEDFDGNSYFEGYTPWRALRVGNSAYRDYKLENNSDGNAVRLGDNSETPGTIEKSGLIYMPVGDKLVTSSTQAVRGKLRTSFTVNPEIIGETGYQVYFTPEFNSSGAKAFEIVDNSGAPAVVTSDGYANLEASKWYDVDLEFDVLNHTIATTVKEHGSSTAVASFIKEDTKLSAVKGILFNAANGTSVLIDDVKLEYGGVSVVITGVKCSDKIQDATVENIVSDDVIYITVDYSNHTESKKSVVPVIAYFNSKDEFIGHQTINNVAIPVGAGSARIQRNIKPESLSGETSYVKVFLWDGMDNITPFCNAETFTNSTAE